MNRKGRDEKMKWIRCLRHYGVYDVHHRSFACTREKFIFFAVSPEIYDVYVYARYVRVAANQRKRRPVICEADDISFRVNTFKNR